MQFAFVLWKWLDALPPISSPRSGEGWLHSMACLNYVEEVNWAQVPICLPYFPLPKPHNPSVGRTVSDFRALHEYLRFQHGVQCSSAGCGVAYQSNSGGKRPSTGRFIALKRKNAASASRLAEHAFVVKHFTKSASAFPDRPDMTSAAMRGQCKTYVLFWGCIFVSGMRLKRYSC